MSFGKGEGEGEVQENKRQILARCWRFCRGPRVRSDQEKTPLRSKYGFSVGQVRGCEERGQTTAISGARGDVRDSNFELNLNEMNGCVIPFVCVPIIIERERVDATAFSFIQT
jgi:hypothetical protein